MHVTDGDSTLGDDSRRSFIKKGALATGALALGATGSAAAQTDQQGTETTPGDDGGTEALIQVGSFHPRGRFIFVSGVVDWTPDVPDVSDDVWASYNTYMIRWLNTNEIVPLWLRAEAEIGGFDSDIGSVPDDDDDAQPELYQMQRGWNAAQQGENLVEVTIDEVPEDPADVILENDEWWQDGGGAAGTPTSTPSTTPTSTPGG